MVYASCPFCSNHTLPSNFALIRQKFSYKYHLTHRINNYCTECSSQHQMLRHGVLSGLSLLDQRHNRPSAFDLSSKWGNLYLAKKLSKVSEINWFVWSKERFWTLSTALIKKSLTCLSGISTSCSQLSTICQRSLRAIISVVSAQMQSRQADLQNLNIPPEEFTSQVHCQVV